MPKLSDFRPQEENTNKHTERGMRMLDKSISERGFIGAITAAADRTVFDGCARLETAYDRFGDVEPIVVRADGSRPVIVMRTDIPTARDPKARKLSIEANRIAQVNLDIDAEILQIINEDQTIDISDLYFDNELEELFEGGATESEEDPLSFDQLSDKSDISITYLKWGKITIALSEDELELLNSQYNEYVREHGASFGFVRWMCG